MTQDRLQELASSSARLTEILGQLRGNGLREVVGPDPLLRADVSNAVLDEFLSLAAREAAEHVIFGLALSLPVLVIRRGVGEEALEYCLAHRNLSPDERLDVFGRMSMPGGSFEGPCATHRRISSVAVRMDRTTHYHSFLRDNIDELVEQCPGDLADFLLDPRFSPSGYGFDCLVLAIKHTRNSEPYLRRWIDWIAEERFDSPGPGHYQASYMYGYLQDLPDHASIRAVRDAAHTHIIHLLRSPEKVVKAWHNLEGLLRTEYAAADEVVMAIRRSGLRTEQLGSDVLRYPLSALGALSRDPTGQSNEFETAMRLVEQNRPQ